MYCSLSFQLSSFSPITAQTLLYETFSPQTVFSNAEVSSSQGFPGYEITPLKQSRTQTHSHVPAEISSDAAVRSSSSPEGVAESPRRKETPHSRHYPHTFNQGTSTQFDPLSRDLAEGLCLPSQISHDTHTPTVKPYCSRILSIPMPLNSDPFSSM